MAEHRLFIGLEIPPELKRALLSVKTPLPGARWQSAQQMHVTLVFLGSIPDQGLADLPERLGRLELTPFHLNIQGLGRFGSSNYPKVLWAGLEPIEPLAQLHQRLLERLAPLGIGTEAAAFKPHITLARFKGRVRGLDTLLEEHKDFKAGEFRVDRLTLFKSHLSPEGSSYEILHRFSLAGT